MEGEVKNKKPATLKSYLIQFSKEQLISQIVELNKKYKEVKKYYKFSLNPDIGKKKEEVRELILECFYPKRGYKLRLKEARKAITDFKKFDPDEATLADVMITM